MNIKKGFTFLKLSVILIILGLTTYKINTFVNMSELTDVHQTAAWFGVGGDEFEPVKDASNEIESKIKWAIFIFAVLILLILAYLFDITALSTRLTGRQIFNTNKINGILMMLFLIVGMYFAFWEFFEHGKLTLTFNASSKHGEEIDSMFMWTLLFTGIVFVATQVVLFWYSYRYKHSTDRKATYYAHNNKLEIFWTIIPAIVLTFLVLRGYATWKTMMPKEADKNAQVIEVFAFQFGWTARYPGADNTFGPASFNYISSTNPLGLAVESEAKLLEEELRKDTASINNELANLSNKLKELKNLLPELKASYKLSDYETTLKEIASIESGEKEDELQMALRRKTKQLQRMSTVSKDDKMFAKMFTPAVEDDILTKEIYLVKNKPVLLKFRAKDVIHSAYLPYFRVQMNCVPGMPTQFGFTPTKTTAQIRKEKGDEEFDYYLFCAKICGGAHYNMRIKVVVVESEAEYSEWMSKQKPAFPKVLPVVEKQLNDSNSVVLPGTTAMNL